MLEKDVIMLLCRYLKFQINKSYYSITTKVITGREEGKSRKKSKKKETSLVDEYRFNVASKSEVNRLLVCTATLSKIKIVTID